MIIHNLSEVKNKFFFVIIIGSGPAGISTALKLEKKNINSLIIEAGNLEPDSNSSLFLNGDVIGDDTNDLTTSRVRGFGGTSAIWGGNCNPMREYDFDAWPLKKNDLEKYEYESSKILNLKHKFYNETFNENLNIYNLAWSNVKFGEKYINHIQKSKNIFLSMKTTFLNFISNNKIIKQLECTKNNQKFKLNANYFILSCGGIENSRLLLWSNYLNQNLIDSKLPIGKYYMNHPYHSIGEGVIEYNKFFSFLKLANIKNKPILTCNNHIYISANKKFLKKNNIPNSGIYIQFKTINKKNNLIKQLRCVAPKYVKNLYEKMVSKDIYKIKISTLQEQLALKENYIDLSNKKDPNNIPLTKIYWKKSILEKKSARAICEELADIFLNKEIGRLALKEYLYNESLDYKTVSGNHQLGGTRIGENKYDSVVDKNLKVHGVKNLFINGSSIFRTGGHAHPTYTIVKLSLRLADHLSKLDNIY